MVLIRGASVPRTPPNLKFESPGASQIVVIGRFVLFCEHKLASRTYHDKSGFVPVGQPLKIMDLGSVCDLGHKMPGQSMTNRTLKIMNVVAWVTFRMRIIGQTSR